MKDDLQYLLSGLLQLKSELKTHSKYILERRVKDISLSTDKFLNDKISNLLLSKSDYPILSEEDDDQVDFQDIRGYCWIIDPLDGTVNYYRSIPVSCISVALWLKQQPIMGIVVDLNRDETFVAVLEKNPFNQDKGIWLNGKSVKVSSVREKNQGVVCTGFPSEANFKTENLMGLIKQFQDWQKVRLLGSAALSLAWVSCGRLDAFFEEDIHIWDVAAGLALVKAAGGEIYLKVRERKNVVTAIATNGKISSEELLK
jgi:myo-inositol-1(or 4)-monophosphatase